MNRSGKPQRKAYSPERAAVIADQYARGVDIDDIVAAVNALPGDAVDGAFVRRWASARGIPRPTGYFSEKHRAQAKAQRRVKVAARKSVAAEARLPRERPPIRTADVETFLAVVGATRCPPALCEVTTARLSERDAAALRAHQDAREAARDPRATIGRHFPGTYRPAAVVS
jgi:hypothetical protein